MVKDPVCGTGVEESASDTLLAIRKGERFYFCSVECMRFFLAEPALYAQSGPETRKMATDPVCGMDVDVANPPAISVHPERTYYFCSHGCRLAFDADPQAYLGKSGESTDASPFTKL